MAEPADTMAIGMTTPTIAEITADITPEMA